MNDFTLLKHENLIIRKARVSDAKQIVAWWNNGALMAHAGFPYGLGVTDKEVINTINQGLLIIEIENKLIGECNYHNVADDIAEIGIKIFELDYQNHGIGKKALSMLIDWLFSNGYSKIICDTNLLNKRAQHVYESLGFHKVGININSWKDQLGSLQSSVDYELIKKDFISYI